jgi:hypothetical protein
VLVIAAVAFCPHPPVLLPDVAQGAAPELDELRAACRAAVKRIAEPGAPIVAIGAGERAQRHAASARGSLARYGVSLTVPLGSDAPGPVELPLSLTVGAWLLREALGPDCGAVGRTVSRTDPDTPDVCSGAVALLVMGDGSARRSTSAPGYLDERAVVFDAAVAGALRSGDPGALRVDVALGAELLAAGAPVWHAVAGLLEPFAWDAELLYDDAPYGVGYFVAAWTRRA